MQDSSSTNQNFQATVIQKKFSHIKFANKHITFIIFIYILSGIIIELVNPLHQGRLLGYLQGLAQLLFIFFPPLLFSRYSPLSFKKLFRLESKPDMKIILLSIIGIISLSVFETSFLFLQERMIPEFLLEIYKTTGKAIDEMYIKILGGSGLSDCIRAFAIGAIIPALSEETLFRGFYQRSLEEELKPYIAILITGSFFAFVHFNPIDIIPLLLIGFYLGIVAYGTQSLIVPVILHFLNNAIAIIIMYIPAFSQLDSKSYQLTITSAIILSIISITLLILISIYIYRNYPDSKVKIEEINS